MWGGNRTTWKSSLVRLGVSVHRGCKSLTGGASRRETESNCVMATWRGEQLEVNGQSVEQRRKRALRHKLDTALCD
jgi:hypothetical protein